MLTIVSKKLFVFSVACVSFTFKFSNIETIPNELHTKLFCYFDFFYMALMLGA